MTTDAVGAVVLAGGRSSRFGRDKLSEPLDGKPLLHHAIDALRPIASEIIVVAAPGGTLALPHDVILAHDAVSFEGPLAGLLAGLAVASTPIVVVAGGDMPTLSSAVVASMLAVLMTSEAGAVVLEHEGRGRPLPMALRREPGMAAAERLLGGGERRLRALAFALSAVVLPDVAWRAMDPDGRTLRDVDTEADLD